MDSKPLFLTPVEFHTALKAVQDWHYSGTCTTLMKSYGVFEYGVFRGVVCYSQGAASAIAKPFGLKNHEVRELVRVALKDPTSPVSKIVAISLRLFKKAYPDCKAIVSYADTAQHHVGTIYQASNWIYLGAKSYHCYRVNGEIVHPKSLYSRYGVGGQSVPWLQKNVDPKAERIKTPPKHKYLWCFDPELDREWRMRSQPYPKCVAGADSGTV